MAQQILRSNPVLLDKISNACHLGKDEVVEVLTEVIKFLNLIAYAEEKLTPAKLIDLAWHEFILCTQAYADFCQVHFKRMIHHHPGGTREANRKQYRRTLQLYRQFFERTKFWGSDTNGNCGACHS